MEYLTLAADAVTLIAAGAGLLRVYRSYKIKRRQRREAELADQVAAAVRLLEERGHLRR
ncbi:MAG: hypothetical protein JO013_07620 [Alphaproteobacteria bacterium]|nr:hypothetical protein [Alphaproteobacteria bacterium]